MANIRRLLTYLVIDTSGSMRGEAIEAVNTGLQALGSALSKNPYALETVHLSIITFNSEIEEVMPLTPLDGIQIPEIKCPQSGGTNLGEALKMLVKSVNQNRRPQTLQQKGDWRPICMILTDGKVTDLMEYEEAIPMMKACNFVNIIACAAGPRADPEQLKKLTDVVVMLDTMDRQKFISFFEWVTDTFETRSHNAGCADGSAGMKNLPPPPPEINVVF